MLSSTALRLLRGVQDTPGGGGSAESAVQDGPQLTIMGWPAIVNDDLPSPGPNAKSVYFGNLAADTSRESAAAGQPFSGCEERFGEQLAIGYQGYSSIDGRPDDPAALRCYQHGS